MIANILYTYTGSNCSPVLNSGFEEGELPPIKKIINSPLRMKRIFQKINFFFVYNMILKDGYDWFKNMQIRWRRITLNIVILTSSNNIQKDSKLKDKKSEMTEVIWKRGCLPRPFRYSTTLKTILRAVKCGFWRSEVWFLMGTQNFFLCPTLVTRQKTTSFSNSHNCCKHIPGFIFVSLNSFTKTIL